MKSRTPRKTVRSLLSLVFVLALFFTCLGPGESSALNAGQSEETELERVNAALVSMTALQQETADTLREKEAELESLRAELEKLKAELEQVKAGSSSVVETSASDPRLEETRQQVNASQSRGDFEAALAAIDAARVQLGDPMALEDTRQQVLQAQYDEFCSAVSAYDSDILLPAQESLRLPSQRVVKYVQGSYGQGILLTRDHERKISTLPDGTKVTIYAIEDGGAFVQVSDGRYGWTVLRLLTEKYDEELHHQRLVDYITREKKLWTSPYWRSFILDNAADFPAEVVAAANG